MLKFIAKRILHLIPVVIIISIILFGMLKVMPGDPVRNYIGMDSRLTEAQIERLRDNLGLNQPIHIQYLSWAKRMVTGDFGQSNIYKRPVVDIVGNFIKNSFTLNIVVFVFAFMIAIPVGIKSAVKRLGPFDNFWSVFSLLGISMPSFFFGYILIFFFAVQLKWFPISGMVTAGRIQTGIPRAMDIAKHMVLPASVLIISNLASLVRYVRNSMLEVINQDYIRTARAKGLTEKVVIYKHAFRNALIPIVTLIGLYIPGLFSGAIILERVFVWPGIGNVLYTALIRQDNSMVMTVNIFFAIMMLLGNLIADVSYALVDPRVKTN